MAAIRKTVAVLVEDGACGDEGDSIGKV